MKFEVFVVLDPDTGKPLCTNQNSEFDCVSPLEEVAVRFAGRFGLGAAATRKLVTKMTPQGKGTIKGYPHQFRAQKKQTDGNSCLCSVDSWGFIMYI